METQQSACLVSLSIITLGVMQVRGECLSPLLEAQTEVLLTVHGSEGEDIMGNPEKPSEALQATYHVYTMKYSGSTFHGKHI